MTYLPRRNYGTGITWERHDNAHYQSGNTGSKASTKELAGQYNLNPKTVTKWRKRTSIHDASMGPKNPSSTVLTTEEEAICVAFRKHALLPLDDCLYTLQATIPHLSRSALHRCYQRHGISRLTKINHQWTKEPGRFNINPFHHTVGLNT